MTMLKLKKAQRKVLVETLRDVANVAVAALVFGQALSDHRYSSGLAALGICVWLVVVASALVLARREN